MRKVIVSAFIVFNTFMVGMVNGPYLLARLRPAGITGHHWNNPFARTLDRLSWYAGWYPYLTGTNLIATMFSTVQRGSWLIHITAYDRYGRAIALPLPFQSPRTLLQQYFFDHKEGKFFNNLYNNQEGCRHYADYLCRHYSNPTLPIQHVKFEIISSLFYSRDEARLRGTHLQSPSPPWLTGDYQCPN